MDFNDEDNLVKTLQCLKLFSDDAGPALQNIATKDIVTVNIENDLLMARQKGQDQDGPACEKTRSPNLSVSAATRSRLKVQTGDQDEIDCPDGGRDRGRPQPVGLRTNTFDCAVPFVQLSEV